MTIAVRHCRKRVNRNDRNNRLLADDNRVLFVSCWCGAHAGRSNNVRGEKGMKYIIDVPDEHTDIKVFYTDADMKIIQSMRLESYTEPDRKAIEDEVWELARRIICPSDCCEDSISKYTEEFLGIPSHKARAIFKDLSYQEAKAKYEAWSKQNIREGDEVIYNSRTRAVVLKPETKEKYGTILTSEFATISVSYDDLKKTGRHFDEIEELLKKMRGADTGITV